MKAAAAAAMQSKFPELDGDSKDASFVTVEIPEGVEPGSMVNFTAPDGHQYGAVVPAGYKAKETFKVQFLNGVVFQAQLVKVPEGAKPGKSVTFRGPCGQPRMARIPEGVKPMDSFCAHVPVPQPVAVVAHEGATPGDEVMFMARDGRPRKAVVPEGICGGQTFMAMVDLQPVIPDAPVEPLEASDLEPWLKAARQFRMNSDFEVPSAEMLDKLDFPGLMAAMKKESAGKLTIQALSDKIILSRMLDNMSMPQMPMLLAIRDAELISEEVRRFVKDCIHEDTQDLIVKPTHLSNAEGVTTIAGKKADEKPQTVEFLESHLQTYMNKKAQEFESEALQSLKPGFVVQPKYKSSVGFHIPLELRIVTLWGKARMGIWWWGVPYTGTPFQRNTWVVRSPTRSGELSDDDQWEVAHQHPGNNTGFSKALELFLKHMPQMAKAAEELATAVGAPFLRTDFFVGDPKWGVRLNEVAYGSGCLHRRFSNKGGKLLVDDAQAMAQILREGMAECKEKLPARRFLDQLGVHGSKYEDLTVNKVLGSHDLSVNQAPSVTNELLINTERKKNSVPKELCETPRRQCSPPGFVSTVEEYTNDAVSRSSSKSSADSEENRSTIEGNAEVNRVRVSSKQASTQDDGCKKAQNTDRETKVTGPSMFDLLVSAAPAWFGFQKAGQKRLPQHGFCRVAFCRPEECRKSEFVIQQEAFECAVVDDPL